ncbi:hypothetical protein RD792_004254 [Penstemon davidsonii]|uniref:S1-like domain-containing protein n=1 Tax=Penstemon davidsonii TaxID=160366 RepID=A0ABR0DGY5_9LAMI|nr:hypothetical protein RD792_004254 [Penstemon davidsonii]
MPRNKGNRKRGEIEADLVTRDPFRKECGEEYAQVISKVLNGICGAVCLDGITRTCHVSDELLNIVGVVVGDILLVRPHKNKKKRSADVILKFMPEEAMLLKAHGVLPEDILLNEGILGGTQSEEVEFNDEDEDEDIYTI